MKTKHLIEKGDIERTFAPGNLVISNYNNVVLVTKPLLGPTPSGKFTGILIHRAEGTMEPNVGEVSSNWNKSFFALFRGEITLEQ